MLGVIDTQTSPEYGGGREINAAGYPIMCNQMFVTVCFFVSPYIMYS